MKMRQPAKRKINQHQSVGSMDRQRKQIDLRFGCQRAAAHTPGWGRVHQLPLGARSLSGAVTNSWRDDPG